MELEEGWLWLPAEVAPRARPDEIAVEVDVKWFVGGV